jgi:superoxide dismutase, Fe-Mn family
MEIFPMKRREFIAGTLAAGAGLAVGHRLYAANPQPTTQQLHIKTGDDSMPFQQPPLPFAMNEMKPFLSEEQLTYHYGKHHAAYFKNLNALVDGKPEAAMSLADVIVQSSGPIFNNAAQAWNHSFYWDCMIPRGLGEPKGDFADALKRDFGGMDNFKKTMGEAAVKLFGSGWAWLASDANGKLEIMPLGNADTPLKHGKKPLLTIDVWEHAYYVDYRNERPKYVETFWSVVNWDFVQKCFAS